MTLRGMTYQRCQNCRHTLEEHERDGWTCDCTCPWKSLTERLHFPLPDGIIADVVPAPTGVGTHVKVPCGCTVLYVCGRWRSLVGMCWDHEAQTRIGASICIGHPALCN